MPIIQNRRQFLTSLSAAGAAGLLGTSRALAAEGPLETTTVRIGSNPAICTAPKYIAEELLRGEGFTDIRYIKAADGQSTLDSLGRGEIDFDTNYAVNFATAIDAGQPITLLAGIMVGCYELFAKESIRGISDLKGKSVGMQAIGSLPYTLLTVMATQVGLDPGKDIRWITDPKVKPIERFVAGEIDAFLAFPPEPQELRARGIGHVLVNTALDRPWSQYFCCMQGANREFARNYPVATKRVLRAVLKAADMCASEPERAARRLVDGGFTPRYDYALQTLRDNAYDRWREYDPEDTIRFYALRLREAGFIKASPQKIIAENTDWRFLNEVKRELKA